MGVLGCKGSGFQLRVEGQALTDFASYRQHDPSFEALILGPYSKS